MAILAQMVDGVVTHKFELNAPKLTIGRLTTNDIIIDDSSVSSSHAVIERKPNPDFPEIIEFYLHDLESTNGTTVNGERISRPAQLHHNDEVRIAWNTFKFLDESSLNLSKTVQILE